jgi:hypothetical protein
MGDLNRAFKGLPDAPVNPDLPACPWFPPPSQPEIIPETLEGPLAMPRLEANHGGLDLTAPQSPDFTTPVLSLEGPLAMPRLEANHGGVDLIAPQIPDFTTPVSSPGGLELTRVLGRKSQILKNIQDT